MGDKTMTDTAAEVPAQPAATEPAAPVAAPADSAPAADASADEADKSTVDAIRDRAAEVASDVANQAGEALKEAGEAVQEAAGRAVEATKEAASNVVTRLRNNATLPADRGHTTIANEVVEKIAGIAAREVPGVFDLGGDVARVFTAVRERLHLGEESAAQGVSVKLEGKTAEIVVTIVIEFGFQVYSVTDKVREKVISSVENLLGLDVTSVDVTVDDVHIPDEGPVGNDAERAAGYTAETKAIVVGEPSQHAQG
jgi:uncharacterized alkaline shock family protein YloU